MADDVELGRDLPEWLCRRIYGTSARLWDAAASLRQGLRDPSLAPVALRAATMASLAKEWQRAADTTGTPVPISSPWFPISKR